MIHKMSEQKVFPVNLVNPVKALLRLRNLLRASGDQRHRLRARARVFAEPAQHC
jgi:hypothetical protein